jgi:hypothetical protein
LAALGLRGCECSRVVLREEQGFGEIAEELGRSLATLLAVYSHVIRRYRGK